MLLQPEDEVLRHFNVQLVAELGGRANYHWLVQSKRKRFVLRRWAPQWAQSIDYELRLLSEIAALGWPVAPALSDPYECDAHLWTLSVFLPGEPRSEQDPGDEQRARGRLMAEFHTDLARLRGFGQRGNWRRCEEILADATLDRVLAENEQHQSEYVRMLRWHLDRARRRIADLSLEAWTGQIVHGDFTTWNLRFQNGRLCGILDFELAHLDHRIGDFALAWRGKYDEVIRGYHEVAPLADQEWEAITPMWWAFLLNDACQLLSEGAQDDGWVAKKLLIRSPLMGADSAPYQD